MSISPQTPLCFYFIVCSEYLDSLLRSSKTCIMVFVVDFPTQFFLWTPTVWSWKSANFFSYSLSVSNCGRNYKESKKKKNDNNKKHSENADTSTPLTLMCDLDLTSRSRKLEMSLIVLCLGSRYGVCEFNSLQDMTINSFL